MSKDALSVRMGEFYEIRTQIYLPRRNNKAENEDSAAEKLTL